MMGPALGIEVIECRGAGMLAPLRKGRANLPSPGAYRAAAPSWPLPSLKIRSSMANPGLQPVSAISTCAAGGDATAPASPRALPGLLEEF